ncbi:TetR/AcrR family transcriptional regulator [Actinoplanes sp. CA-131856]
MARPTQDRAEAILGAARAQFLQTGSEHTTVDDIAARAGVGKGTVFLYWPSKTRLREAVLLLEVARMFADLIADLAGEPALLRLGTIVRREIAAGLSNPDLAPLLVDRVTTGPKPPEAPRRALQRIIATMGRRGLIQDVEPGRIVMGIETVLIGALFRVLADPGNQETLLDAVEHLVSSSYDRDGADPRALAEALPEALEALEDAIDQLVEAASPDRPTTARLRPRERLVSTRSTEAEAALSR